MEKEQFKTKAKATLTELTEKLKELDSQKDMFEAQTKARNAKEIADLKVKKEELKMKYKKLENSSQDNWDDVKKAFTDSVENFKSAWKNIKARTE